MGPTVSAFYVTFGEYQSKSFFVCYLMALILTVEVV